MIVKCFLKKEKLNMEVSLSMKLNKILVCMITVFVMLNCSACGDTQTGNKDAEGLTSETTEMTEEKEPEFRIEIADAEEILTKTWDVYKEEERFDIMGGHFYSAKIGVPAKYDLTETVDLEEMFCVPQTEVKKIDNAATMVDFYNAARFTAGAFHIKDGENVEKFIEAVKTQVYENQWHGEAPKKLMIMKIDEQYVVAVFGREPLVNEFKLNMESIYKSMIKVEVSEKLELTIN